MLNPFLAEATLLLPNLLGRHEVVELQFSTKKNNVEQRLHVHCDWLVI